MRGGRIRTNALDFNKDVSEQIAWPYINHAEALGDLPLFHRGSFKTCSYKITSLQRASGAQTLYLRVGSVCHRDHNVT